jgi:7tm Chemosensory receptor
LLNVPSMCTLYVSFVIDGSKLDIMTEVKRSLAFMVAISTIVQNTNQLLNVHKIVDIVKSIQKFDDSAMKSRIYINYHKNARKISLISMSVFIMLFYFVSGSYFVVTYHYLGSNYDLQICFAYQMFIVYFYFIQLTSYVYVIQERFRKLNKFLHSIDEKTADAAEFESFFKLHHSMYKITKQLNEVFSKNFNYCLIQTMLRITFSTYGFISLFYGSEEKFTWLYFGIYLMWTIDFVIMFPLICCVGNSLESTVEKCEEIILDKIAESSNLKSIARLKKLYLRLKYRNRNIKIQSQFVEINWKLLLMVSFLIKIRSF